MTNEQQPVTAPQVNEGGTPPPSGIEAEWAAKQQALEAREARLRDAEAKIQYVDQLASRARMNPAYASLLDSVAQGTLSAEAAAALMQGGKTESLDPDDPSAKAVGPLKSEIAALREHLARIDGREELRSTENQINQAFEDPVLKAAIAKAPQLKDVFRRNLLASAKENHGLGIAAAAQALSGSMRAVFNQQAAVQHEQAKAKSTEQVVSPSLGSGGTVNQPPPERVTNFYRGGQLDKSALARSRDAVLAKIKAQNQAPNP